MKKSISAIFFLILLGFLPLKTAAQGFFNLTADEVRIDSVLPCFVHSLPLKGNYADSAYTVRIDYPEFVDMTDGDIRRLKAITQDPLPEMPEVDSYIGIARKKAQLDLSFVPLVMRDGKYKKLVSFKLTLVAQPINRPNRAASQNAAARYADNSVLQTGTWAKIRVKANGIHNLSDALIRKCGFTKPEKVRIYGYGGNLQPESLDGAYLTETDDLKEVPTYRVNGRRLFYAKGPVYYQNNVRVRNPYSDYGYYFLTQGDGEPLYADSLTLAQLCATNADDRRYTLYEVDDYAWFEGGRNLYDSQLLQPTTLKYELDAANPNTRKGRLVTVVTADAPSMVEVTFNDSVVGTVSVGKVPKYSVATVNSMTSTVNNVKGKNTIGLRQLSGGKARLDYLLLRCDAEAAVPDFANAAFPTPEYVYHITNQNHHADTAVDMVILISTNQKLRAQAEKLKELHEKKDGMTVRIVPVDELYNEFSSGTPDATAYKRYLKMFYDRDETGSNYPTHLLLMGDGVWDNRMLTPGLRRYSPDDFLLCFESENSFSETECYVSDDFYCLMDDKEAMATQTGSTTRFAGKPDVAVGRIPARNVQEAEYVVGKIKDYCDNIHAGSWQNSIVVMGDDGDVNIHMDDAINVADTIGKHYPHYNVKRILWDTYKSEQSSTGVRYPDVTRLIQRHMRDGALMMNYSGHGAPYQMSHEHAVDISDFRDIATNGLPLWLTASCDIMPYDGTVDNIGETALFNPTGGAIAFYGTTRTVYSTYNRYMNLRFTKNVLRSGVTIGEAVRLTKTELVEAKTSTDNTANKLQYTLLGDPAIRLAVPEKTIIVDSINGKKPDLNAPQQLKSGSVVVVSGHIVENDGTPIDSFNGTVSIDVKDAWETIKCRLNQKQNPDRDSAYVFRDRLNVIFSGHNLVKDGKFDISFVVPRDIAYTNGTGFMSLYATNEDNSVTAAGYNEAFFFKGTDSAPIDSIGPSVYCYLNSPSFTNGDKVNPTPYFMAELKDEDGINATGSGIGHDMQLIIDGKMARTYSLSSFFRFDFGSYTSGNVGFSIPELEPGFHKLKFRVWDVINNSTTAELSFVVAADSNPDVNDVFCLQNPAYDKTTFRITHNRAGAMLDVAIDVYDSGGRLVHTVTDRGMSVGNAYDVEWDLTHDGHRLSNGLYVYNVRLACEGSSYTSKANKLVIYSNK